ISRASEWSGALSKDSFNNSTDMASLKRAFNKLATDEGLSPVLTNKEGNIYSNAAKKIIDTAPGSADVSREALLIDLSKLVGLGIGFTPSGDDFLAGIMLYETMSGVCLINRDSVRTRIQGTTEGGRTLLSLALRNSFPFYLKQFAEKISIYNFPSQVVVQQALSHGSTSGSDSLAGFLWAAERNRKLEP
ncbi:MAG: DUF2877 domain-containing protein, partial [Spirochaetaceae bacterium]|nr:DUF2877 domain-containing protein [Spirochaetaceae bacterium]